MTIANGDTIFASDILAIQAAAAAALTTATEAQETANSALRGTAPSFEVLIGTNGGTVAAIPNSTAGYALISNGNTAAPSFQALPAAPVQSVVGLTGAVTIAQITAALLASLSTTLPGSAGVLWNNNGVLSIS